MFLLLPRLGTVSVDFFSASSYHVYMYVPHFAYVFRVKKGMAMTQEKGMLKGLVVGLLAGGAIGAVIALLYAPKSGKELRADIREKADDLMEGADEYLQTAKSKAGEIVSEAKKRSDQLITDAKKKADSLLEDADKIISGARQKAGPIVDEASRIKNATKAGIDAYKEERRRS
jgi:gas vesicle protein